jgi:hypothetical protein
MKLYDGSTTRDSRQVNSTSSNLAWCLPKEGDNPVTWTTLLQHPAFLNDDDLSSILHLRQSTRDTPAPGQNTTIYYIRSYAYTVAELTHVIQNLFEEGHYVGKGYIWLEVMADMDYGSPIFLRYSGTSSRSSAWRRNQFDVTRPTQPSDFIRVLQTTSSLYPEIVKKAGIYELPKAEARLGLQQSLLDAREQALIALMGIATSLNTQHGGKFVTFTPDPQMKMEFERMKTKTIQRLRLDTIDYTDAANAQISLYVDAIQAYANDNPHSTGTTQFSFTAELRECYYNQAVPRVLRSTGFSPMAFIGMNPTIASFRTSIPFFNAAGYSTRLVAIIINFFESVEAGRNTVTESITSQLHSERHLPFINLFPWCKMSRQDLPQALGFVRQYLQAARPYIVLTFGLQVR